MKKIFTKLMALIALVLLFPMSTFAQPPGEGWVKLGDYIKGVYNYDKKEHWYILPLGQQDFLPIEKIAYKKINGKNQDKSYICISGIPTFKNANNIRDKFSKDVFVYSNFKIQEGNGDSAKVLNPKDLNTDNEGWTIYSLIPIQPAFITNINDVKKGPDSNIWDNIYVLPGKLNYFACVENHKKEEAEKQRIAEEKAAEEKRIAEKKAYQNLLTRTFTTPANKGLSPVKTETMKDGTIIEYYNGHRFFKKPNGDFASFIENKDERDPKTLEVVSGRSKPINPNSYLVGAYSITLPNNIKLTGDGLTDIYFIPNGDTLKYNKNNIKASLEGNVSSGRLTYSDFFNPADIKNIYKNANDEFIYYPKNSEPFPLYYEELGFFKTPNLFKGNLEDDYSILFYDIDENGLYQSGIKWKKRNSRCHFKTRKKIKSITPDYTYKTNIEFEDGDYLYRKVDEGDQETLYHLENGIVIEEFNIDHGTYKITFPNGDKFVGSIIHPSEPGTDNEGLTVLISDFDEITKNNRWLRTGTLTTAKGKEIEYRGGETAQEIAKKEAAQDAEEQKFYKKYGRDFVYSARLGIIKVGMPLELIRMFMNPYKDRENGSFTWYNVNVSNGFTTKKWYIKVNNKTGKVVSILH